MKPSDTHIERMAETFAERTPFLRRTKAEAQKAWRDALEIGRDTDRLEDIERTMRRKQLLDLPAQDAWDRAREYGEDD